MPSIELQARFEKAVLWPKVTTAPFHDDYGEIRVSDTPVEITVQWVNVRREAVDAQGNTVAIQADVVVDREIAVGSKMWYGELADWTGTGSGDVDSEVLTVLIANRQRDIKGRNIRRTVSLGKFRADLPEQG